VPKSDIEGRTALVTGAAKGIGKAIALTLSDLGVKVAINYKTSAQEAACLVNSLQAKGVDSISIQADVSNRDQANNMVNAVLDKWGQIDILVNNAGIINDGLLVRMSDEDWDKVIATNLSSTFHCSRAVIRGMMRRRWGRIINIGSVVGLRGNIGQVNYTASKAGMVGFTYALAKEVASRSITVNTVAPGYISTDTVDVLTQDQKSKIMTWIPQGHFGEPEDVANLVGFLAEEKANYITGQVICVDGGMAI
jgi:3-oxoacyl-[acyl-carrier protein] reductase